MAKKKKVPRTTPEERAKQAERQAYIERVIARRLAEEEVLRAEGKLPTYEPRT